VLVFDVVVKTGYSEKVNGQISGLKKQRIDRFGQDLTDVDKQGSFEEAMVKEEGCRVVGTA
jgi:hypothetical protein